MLTRGIPFSLRPALPAVLTFFVLSAGVELYADVKGAEEGKPGFFGKIFKGGTKEEPAPPPPAEKPKAVEKPKVAAKPKTEASRSSTAPGPKPKVTTLKPKGESGGSSKSTAKTGNSTPKKKSEAAEKVSPPAKKTEATPSKETAEKAAPTPGKKGEGEFGNGDDEDKPTEKPEVAKTEAPAEATPSPLPSSQAAGWEIVKINGRDYVTGESINRFYRFSSYKVEGPHVWLRSNNLIMKGQIGTQELLINNIKFILSYPVEESNGRALFSRLDLCKLIDPVLRPSHITDAQPFDTVVVDAGHGGHDTGARGVYGYEKDFALKMAFTLKEILERRGLKVVLSRPNDTFITLGGRVAIANQTPNSIFVSLHFNSGGTAATGIETFALTPQGSSASLERGGGFNANGLTGNSHDSANIALATAVHAMVISRFKFVDRGIKRAQWSVLTGCKRPGILFEGGFVTNPTECRLIVSDTYRQSVCTAIADAVTNYRRALMPALTNRR